MKETVRIQNEIDELAEMRVYWRDMRNFLCAEQSKDMAKVLKRRIENLRDSKISDLDNADPIDAVTIAKAQSGRDVLKKIISEMDESVCESQIAALDAQIKLKTEEMKSTTQKQQGAQVQNIYKDIQKKTHS